MDTVILQGMEVGRPPSTFLEECCWVWGKASMDIRGHLASLAFAHYMLVLPPLPGHSGSQNSVQHVFIPTHCLAGTAGRSAC